MCAIFGIIGEYDSTLARKAVSILSHRGPDYWSGALMFSQLAVDF